jgi:hypothetical protein
MQGHVEVGGGGKGIHECWREDKRTLQACAYVGEKY